MKNILTLSLEGNIATRRQVTALAEALAQHFEAEGAVVQGIVPMVPAEAERRSNNIVLTWRQPPGPGDLAAVACAEGKISAPWPDIVISCRPEVAGLALGIKQASGGKTKVVHIQNPNDPAGNYQFDTGQFDLIVRQPQEKIRGPNVISSEGAIHGLTPSIIAAFNRASLRPSDKPLTAILVGGTDEHVNIDGRMMSQLASDVAAYVQTQQCEAMILTSRRTGEANVATLKAGLSGVSNVTVDDPKFSYNELLGTADAFVVTAESLSMVSEALATGKPVALYDFHGSLAGHPLSEAFGRMREKKILTDFDPAKRLVSSGKNEPYDELPTLSDTIRARLGF